MDKIEVVRSEVVEPSSDIKRLVAPTGGNDPLKPKQNFYQRPHQQIHRPAPHADAARCIRTIP